MNNSIDTKLVPDTWEITWPVSKSSIKVIGVGGGGCNSVNEMCRQNIKGVDFIICNTDTQSLRMYLEQKPPALEQVWTRSWEHALQRSQ